MFSAADINSCINGPHPDSSPVAREKVLDDRHFSSVSSLHNIVKPARSLTQYGLLPLNLPDATVTIDGTAICHTVGVEMGGLFDRRSLHMDRKGIRKLIVWVSGRQALRRQNWPKDLPPLHTPLAPRTRRINTLREM